MFHCARHPWALPFATLTLLSAARFAAPSSEPESPGPIRGYSAKGTATEREIEKRFRAIPSPDEARRWHRAFTKVPHPATSPANREIALQIAGQWKAQGLEDVVIRQYDVLSSNPREVRVEMLAPTRYVPTLREDTYKEDPDTAHPEVSGAWVSFSGSGDVTAPVRPNFALFTDSTAESGPDFRIIFDTTENAYVIRDNTSTRSNIAQIEGIDGGGSITVHFDPKYVGKPQQLRWMVSQT